MSKQLRARRLEGDPSRGIILCPLDHGVTMGPIDGICDMRATLRTLKATRVRGVIVHKGSASIAADELRDTPDLCVILHLSASVGVSPHRDQKVLVSSVEEAARIGADAVSVHVNIGCEGDREMLGSLGWVSGECQAFGMPLLCMMYPRGRDLDERSPDHNATCARVAAELGADYVKVNYTGSPDSFERVVRGAQVPVLISGGVYRGDENGLIRDIDGALAAGARGVCIGRNVFQNPRPARVLAAIERIVLDREPLSRVLSAITEEAVADGTRQLRDHLS